MYDDQLDFNRNRLNDFILIDNAETSKQELVYNKTMNKQNLNSESIEAYKKNEQNDLPEQLDYLLQPAYNYYPQERPCPLIYDSKNKKNTKNGKKKNKSLNKRLKNSSTIKSKIPQKKKVNNNDLKGNIHINLNINHNILNNPTNNNTKNFNFSSNGNGLFDPHLKKNELGMAKRQDVIKQERQEKIRNYNIKFGKKVENIQMYSNVQDMIEGIELFNQDVSNQKLERQFQKTEIKKKTDKNIKINEQEKIRYISNNLDFNFDKQEEMVKALEKQIENERKLRAEMNIKLVRKAKELEDVKYQNIIKVSSEGSKLNKKVKSTIRTYISGNSKNKFKATNNHYKNELNRTINQVKSTIPKSKIQRSNSAFNVNRTMKQMEPKIDKYVEESLNKLYKNILKSYEKNLDKRSLSTVKKNIKNQLLTSLKSNRINPQNDVESEERYYNDNINLRSNNEVNSYNNESLHCGSNLYANRNSNDVQNARSVNEALRNNINVLYNGPKSIMSEKSVNNDEKLLLATPASFKNDEIISNRNMIMSTNNNNNSIQKFTGNINQSSNSMNKVEKKMIDEIVRNNALQNNSTINKFDLIRNINKEIDHYNKGLPQLISKVENTLEKINQNEILDKKLHPVIKMASKHCGKQVFLHLEELSDKIIDDLLFECVEYLEEIDNVGKKRKEIEKFSTFLSKYSNNFEFIKNFELDLAKKLNGNTYSKQEVNALSSNLQINEEKPLSSAETKEMLIYQNVNNVNTKQYKEENLNLTSSYKNPFALEIEKIDAMKKKEFTSTLEQLNDKHKFEAYDKTGKHRICLNPKVIFEAQKYVETYLDYQRTTGVYFKDNIFVLYDEFVEELVKQILEEEVDTCLNEIDDFAEELYIKEIHENQL